MPTNPFDLKAIILKTLSKSAKHGYQLSKEISENLPLKPSLGGLYPVLSDLEKNGLIRGHEMVEYGRFKKVYSITEKGKQELKNIERQFKLYKNFMEQ